MGEGPLAHLRVLDLTEFLAGPFGTQILGDLGAEIIKVEHFDGDSSRHVPPHYVAGTSTYFLSIGRNKKSMVVDLKHPDGIAAVKALAVKSDILFENRRPGVLARLGLDYDTLRKDNPGLIWCSVSGFGQDGPDRDRAAYDMIVQAMSGVMSLTGPKGGQPVRAGVPIGDVCAGMYGTIGILAAVARRAETGQGDYVDVAMLDVQTALLTYQASVYLNAGKVPGTQGREHDSIPTYRCFAAGDGIEIAVTANTDKMLQDMCEALGIPDTLKDPRFANKDARLKNKDALVPLIEAAFKNHTAGALVKEFLRRGIPCGPINTVDRALAEPQINHRGMILELTGDADGERARVIGNPIKIRDSGRAAHAYPPKLGGDTRAVLRDVLGYDEATIDRMIGARAVADAASLKKAAE
jgi:crotonobetainyl-CoA:carnitine CoA-transferase CaiB-like acyl-CoA transferase